MVYDFAEENDACSYSPFS